MGGSALVGLRLGGGLDEDARVVERAGDVGLLLLLRELRVEIAVACLAPARLPVPPRAQLELFHGHRATATGVGHQHHQVPGVLRQHVLAPELAEVEGVGREPRVLHDLGDVGLEGPVLLRLFRLAPRHLAQHLLVADTELNVLLPHVPVWPKLLVRELTPGHLDGGGRLGLVLGEDELEALDRDESLLAGPGVAVVRGLGEAALEARVVALLPVVTGIAGLLLVVVVVHRHRHVPGPGAIFLGGVHPPAAARGGAQGYEQDDGQLLVFVLHSVSNLHGSLIWGKAPWGGALPRAVMRGSSKPPGMCQHISLEMSGCDSGA